MKTIRLSAAERAVLRLMVEGADYYGLQLIEASHGHLSTGSVYPALRSLERERLVQSREGTPLAKRGGHPRRYYRLTCAGAGVARNVRGS